MHISSVRLSLYLTGCLVTLDNNAAIQAQGAACVSLPPKPPPILRVSTITLFSGMSKTSATSFCTSLGCCDEENIVMPPSSVGSAVDTCPSR